MEAVILVIHLLIASALVGVVLIQRSEGGGLGIGGGASGGFMTARGTANLLTRATAILAGAFMVTSLVLAVLAGTHSRPRSIIDTLPAIPPPGQTAPLTAPVAPSAPAPNQVPSAPLR